MRPQAKSSFPVPPDQSSGGIERYVHAIQAANEPDVAQQLLDLLREAHFQHCLPSGDADGEDGPDYAKRTYISNQLKDLFIEDHTRLTFVEAMAAQNGVREECINSFPVPGGGGIFDGVVSWDEAFNIVCTYIGQKYAHAVFDNRSSFLPTNMILH